MIWSEKREGELLAPLPTCFAALDKFLNLSLQHLLHLYGLETSSVLSTPSLCSFIVSTEHLRSPLGRDVRQKTIKSLFRPEHACSVPCIGYCSPLGTADKPLPLGNCKHYDPTTRPKVHDHTSKPLGAWIGRVHVGGQKYTGK